MKMAWAVVVLLVYSGVSIGLALPELPARIPTKFNSSGEPVGWGGPETLWIMLLAQVLVSALILAVPAIGRRAPQLVNLGFRKLSDFQPEARQRVMPLLEEMCGWLATLFAFLFTVIIRGMIRSALEPGARVGDWPLGVFLVGTAIAVIYYLRKMNRLWDEEARHPSGYGPGDSTLR
jgi:uncharacterized membrane protein